MEPRRSTVLPVPDGFSIYAEMGTYRSEPVEVTNGEYFSLTVAPASGSFNNETIRFFLDGEPAIETDKYRASGVPIIQGGFSLNFARLPDPTPTPSPVPTDHADAGSNNTYSDLHTDANRSSAHDIRGRTGHRDRRCIAA